LEEKGSYGNSLSPPRRLRAASGGGSDEGGRGTKQPRGREGKRDRWLWKRGVRGTLGEDVE